MSLQCPYYISLSLFLCHPKTNQKLKVVASFQKDRLVFQKLNNSLPYKKRRLKRAAPAAIVLQAVWRESSSIWFCGSGDAKRWNK